MFWDHGDSKEHKQCRGKGCSRYRVQDLGTRVQRFSSLRLLVLTGKDHGSGLKVSDAGAW